MGMAVDELRFLNGVTRFEQDKDAFTIAAIADGAKVEFAVGRETLAAISGLLPVELDTIAAYDAIYSHEDVLQRAAARLWDAAGGRRRYQLTLRDVCAAAPVAHAG